MRQVLGCLTRGDHGQESGQASPDGVGGQALCEQRCGEAQGPWALGSREAGVGGGDGVSWVLSWARTVLSRAASGSPSQNSGSPEGDALTGDPLSQ